MADKASLRLADAVLNNNIDRLDRGRSTPYQALGVANDASRSDIKATYQRLSKALRKSEQHEEDGDVRKRLRQAYRTIRAAYQFLKDEQKRAALDAQIAAQRNNDHDAVGTSSGDDHTGDTADTSESSDDISGSEDGTSSPQHSGRQVQLRHAGPATSSRRPRSPVKSATRPLRLTLPDRDGHTVKGDAEPAPDSGEAVSKALVRYTDSSRRVDAPGQRAAKKTQNSESVAAGSSAIVLARDCSHLPAPAAATNVGRNAQIVPASPSRTEHPAGPRSDSREVSRRFHHDWTEYDAFVAFGQTPEASKAEVRERYKAASARLRVLENGESDRLARKDIRTMHRQLQAAYFQWSPHQASSDEEGPSQSTEPRYSNAYRSDTRAEYESDGDSRAAVSQVRSEQLFPSMPHTSFASAPMMLDLKHLAAGVNGTPPSVRTHERHTERQHDARGNVSRMEVRERRSQTGPLREPNASTSAQRPQASARPPHRYVRHVHDEHSSEEYTSESDSVSSEGTDCRNADCKYPHRCKLHNDVGKGKEVVRSRPRQR